MTKSKKHSPIQTETEKSIISQIPQEHMKQAIEELIALGKSRRAQASGNQDFLEPSPMLSREPIQDPARGVLLQAMEKDASQGATSGSILKRLLQAIRR